MREEISDNPLWRGTSSSADDTRRLGHLLAGCLREGDLLALDGELGAGKTQLVRGLAEGLGLDGRQVASPTFVLVHEYQRQRGKLHDAANPRENQPPGELAGLAQTRAGVPGSPGSPGSPGVMVHVDAYRLRSLEDLESIGWSSHESDAGNVLTEMRRGAVVVVEWAEKLGSALGEDLLRIQLEHLGRRQRRITLRLDGRWQERQAVLRRALAAWSASAAPCPICGKPVLSDGEHFPFCGQRCRMVDLGKWLGGDYRISRPAEQRDLEEGMD